jgi:hypothetical protein
MNPLDHPELFDLPGDLRGRRIFRAFGSRLVSPKGARRKKWQHCDVFVNAPTLAIATRTGKRWLKTVHRCRLDGIYEITWHEYARILEKSGFTIEWPAPVKSQAA